MKLSFIIFIIICLFHWNVNAKVTPDTLDTEIGGLKFLSKQVYSSERTSLSLFPKPIKINSDISLSFDCDIYEITRFGYIFRFVNRSEKTEKTLLHLLYNNGIDDFGKPLFGGNAKMVLYSPNTNAKVEFIVPPKFTEKMRISINYISEKEKVIIDINGQEKNLNGINLNDGLFDVVFGLWGKNNDVAAMHVRNIRISDNGRSIYFWPLDEYRGNIAHEKITGIFSEVKKPVWLRLDHYHWNKLNSFISDEMVGVVFKEKDQKIYFVNKDSLVIFSPEQQDTEVLKYANPRPYSKNIHYSIYNESTDQIISYDFRFFNSPAGKQSYSVLNEKTLEWSEIEGDNEHLVKYHHGMIWNEGQGKVTTFGGYGNFSYFNEFITFDFSSNVWNKIDFNGEVITPRTHTVLGRSEETGLVYLYGGFGNEEGQQVMGGKTYFDLYSVDIPNNNIKKLLDFQSENLDFVPRGHLITDNGGKDFYTIGSNMIENTFLQLYHINIPNQTITTISDSIPAVFSNMAGDVFLFKNEIENALYCVCRENHKSGNSLASIYRLKFPPSNLTEVKLGHQENSNNLNVISFSVLLVILSAGLYIARRTRKRRAPINEDNIRKSEEHLRKNENAVWFLGGFKVFDPKGKDITYRFSKKLRELFILVFFETVYREGITSAELSELLWPGMDKVHQKNNRGATVYNLRKSLEDLKGLKLSNVSNKWKIECEDECYFDFLEVKKLLQNIETSENIDNLISLLSFGSILPHLQFEWLDKFKGLYESDATNALYDICDQFYLKKKYLSCLETAQIIHDKFDQLDEIALSYKIRSLNKMKSHKKSQKEFELFKKRYFGTFNEKYTKAIKDIENLQSDSL